MANPTTPTTPPAGTDAAPGGYVDETPAGPYVNETPAGPYVSETPAAPTTDAPAV